MSKLTVSAVLACGLALAGSSAASATDTAQPGALSPVDYAFVGQTYLGNQFQVESGKLAVAHASNPDVKRYGQEMIPSHEEVEQKLTLILTQKGVTQPPTSLLKSSYDAMLGTLHDDDTARFDRDYVRQQVGYQTGNDALYRWELANGTDPDLKAFAMQVLVKIDQHFEQAKALAKALHDRS